MSDKTPEPDEGEAAEGEALLTALGEEAAMRDALAPIEGDEARALFDGVLARVGTAQPIDSSVESPASLRPPGARRLGLLLAAAALILAVGATLLMRSTGPAALPGYELSAGAGDQSFRADPVQVERARYSPGSRVQLIARPAQDVTGPVEARLYLAVGGRFTRLEVPIELSPTGALRLDVRAGEGLQLPEGEGELLLLIRPAGLSADDESLLRAADPTPARRLVHPFVFSR